MLLGDDYWSLCSSTFREDSYNESNLKRFTFLTSAIRAVTDSVQSKQLRQDTAMSNCGDKKDCPPTLPIPEPRDFRFWSSLWKRVCDGYVIGGEDSCFSVFKTPFQPTAVSYPLHQLNPVSHLKQHSVEMSSEENRSHKDDPRQNQAHGLLHQEACTLAHQRQERTFEQTLNDKSSSASPSKSNMARAEGVCATAGAASLGVGVTGTATVAEGGIATASLSDGSAGREGMGICIGAAPPASAEGGGTSAGRV